MTSVVECESPPLAHYSSSGTSDDEDAINERGAEAARQSMSGTRASIASYVSDDFGGTLRRHGAGYGSTLLLSDAHPDNMATGVFDGASSRRISAKSLFMCLVLRNPFNPKVNDDFEWEPVDGAALFPEAAAGAVISEDEFLAMWNDAECDATSDDENDNTNEGSNGTVRYRRVHDRCQNAAFKKTKQVLRSHQRLLLHRVSSTDGGPQNGATRTANRPRVPSMFHKIIELLLRLRARGIDYFPRDALVQTPPDDGTELWRRNRFRGHSLNRGALLISPDGEELFFQVYARRRVLLDFAEMHQIVMATNPYSSAGGAALTFTHESEEKLANSVLEYHRAHPVPEEYLGRKGNAWGFQFDVSHRMRLVIRMLHESFESGGCGIPVNELQKRSDGFVCNFFPLHNRRYLATHGIAKWATFRQLFSRDPLYQNHVELAHYFGPSVALYFVWLRTYTIFLCYPAVLGLIAGVASIAGAPTSLLHGAFGLCLVLWSFAWCRKWAAVESHFSSSLGQDVEEEEQLARRGFKPDGLPQRVDIADIMELRFEYPLTLQRRSDGTIVQLPSSRARRRLVRALVTYPATIVLTALMVASLIWITVWRMNNVDDVMIRYGASALATLCGVIFGKIFDLLLPVLNALENNRTDREEENQLVIKSFFFSFFSNFFAIFSLLLYPTKSSDVSLLQQMSAQMLFISVVRPTIQNAQELLLPAFSSIRRRLAGGRNRGSDTAEEDGSGDSCAQTMWREAHMDEYRSTSDDYLEVITSSAFLSFFGVVFPWAGVAALLYSALELRIDAVKLTHYMRRPIAHTATTIGAWNQITLIITAISIVTNTYLAFKMSPLLSKMSLPSDDASRYLACGVAQYALVLLMYVVKLMTDGTSAMAEKRAAKFSLLRDKVTRKKLWSQLSEKS